MATPPNKKPVQYVRIFCGDNGFEARGDAKMVDKHLRMFLEALDGGDIDGAIGTETDRVATRH